jgi:hypothetical protein
MDRVIFTGRGPLDESKRDRPGESERLVTDGQLEAKLAGPVPAKAERAAKVFGFTARSAGLGLIALIIVSMVFGYRDGKARRRARRARGREEVR